MKRKKIVTVPADAKITRSINAEIYQTLVEYSSEGSLILNAEGKAYYLSPGGKRILGYNAEEVIDISLLELSHPDDFPMVKQMLADVIQKPEILIEIPICRFRHKDGTYRWIECSVTNLLQNPNINAIISNFRDVTNNRIAEDNLTYANRLYDFLSHINKTIVHVTNEDVLFSEACRIAIECGKFKFAWIGIPDQVNGKVQMIASSGTTDRDLEFFFDYSYDTNGPISNILAGMDYFTVDHIQSRNNTKFIAYANDRGFKSAMVLPIKKSGQVFALLSLYADQKSFFTATEIALLLEASGDLSFALEVFDRDHKRVQAEMALHQKEMRFSQAQEIANVGSWDFDFATGASNWSEQALRIYGIDIEQSNQTFQKWISYIHPHDRQMALDIVKEAEKTHSNCAFYHRIVRPDGDIRYVHSNSHIIFKDKVPIGLSGVVHDVTEIEIHREALRASEDAFSKSEFRYRQIVENAHDGIWLLDNENQTIFVNDKMCHILGYNAKEMYGIDFGSFLANGEAANYDLLTSNKILLRFKTKSGKLIWANVIFSPIMESGRLAMVSDITEKKELTELLDNVTNIARIGGYEIDVANNKTSWSQMARNIHEVPDSFLPTLPTTIAFYKEDQSRDILESAINDSRNQGISWDLELQIITAKGNERWVRIIGEPEHIDGECVRIFVSLQDIDSRKRAELEVLLVAEEKNRILESIGDAFFAVDLNWNITYWNKESERLLGRERTYTMGRNLWEIYPEVIGSDYYDYYHKSVRDNTIQHFDAFYSKLQMWTEVSAYPSESGLSVYFKDITEKKNAEVERANMMSEIIRRNKDLEQFSYMVSHNLRAPVANIIGIARELNNWQPVDVEKNLKDGLVVSAERLDEVIVDLNNILHFRKDFIENLESVNLTLLVDSIRDSIVDVVHRENLKIITNFNAVNEILTIKSYLYSIFYNLIVNSIKYKQPNLVPVVTITTANHDNRITITFCDNGLGIDLAKKSSQMFGLYKRFHTHVEGKGVGLFMVKTQVEMLGGTISVTSEPNKGTIFTINFYNQKQLFEI